MPVKTPLAIYYGDYSGRKRRIVVDAEVYGLLAINPAVWKDGSLVRGKWAISHVPTGWAIIGILSIAEARKALKELAKLKWPKSNNPSVTKRRADLHDSVIAIRDRIRAARASARPGKNGLLK